MSSSLATNLLIQAWRNFRLRRHLHLAMKAYAVRLFGPDESKAILNALASCSFPLVKKRSTESERIKIAILLLSKGQQELFQQQLHAARIDWRDVLMAAGMAFENWQAVIRHKGILPT